MVVLKNLKFHVGYYSIAELKMNGESVIVEDYGESELPTRWTCKVSIVGQVNSSTRGGELWYLKFTIAFILFSIKMVLISFLRANGNRNKNK